MGPGPALRFASRLTPLARAAFLGGPFAGFLFLRVAAPFLPLGAAQGPGPGVTRGPVFFSPSQSTFWRAGRPVPVLLSGGPATRGGADQGPRGRLGTPR